MERFDEYVERCLYRPDTGFYSTGRGSAGRGGDFITSPEVGPLFGAVVANYLDACWEQMGRPSELVVIDAGAGPGTLGRTIKKAEPECASVLRMMSVDRSTGIELPEDLSGAIVIANELLDNLAFRQVECRGGEWLDVYVDGSGAESLVDDGAELGFVAADGVRAPLLDRAARWVADALAAGAAHLVVFDYGVETTEELASRGGWLRTYRGHQRGEDPYLEPGHWDITTDIAVDQLPEPNWVGRQSEFLTDNGIEQLVDQGLSYWNENVAAPDVEAFLMRSRANEAPALLDESGLGNWLCLRWSQ